MQFREVAEKIKKGEITLNLCGHYAGRDPKQKILDNYDRMLRTAAGENDNKWNNDRNEPVELVNARMREHFLADLNHEVEESELLFCFMAEGETCGYCGERLNWILDGNQISLRRYLDHHPTDWRESEFRNHPTDYVCPYAEDKPTKGEIKVNSKLLFMNWFPKADDTFFEDAPEDKKYTEEYSLNNRRGIENITKHKVGQNVAYGQMSNMSIGIFLHPNKKSVIVGDPYIADRLLEEMTDEDADKADYDALSIIDGHKLVGSISLGVWRWEATDLNTVGKKNFKEMKKFTHAGKAVELNVEHGTWQFEHYFRMASHWENEGADPIYSRFTLKETP